MSILPPHTSRASVVLRGAAIVAVYWIAWAVFAQTHRGGLMTSLARAQDESLSSEPDIPIDAQTVESLLSTDPPSDPGGDLKPPSGIDLLSLVLRGGGFMIPIGLMSMLVVTLAVERSLSLRRKRVIPKRLVRELEALRDPVDRFDPSAALAVCRDYPSPAATAIEAMLRRTGQPLADVERAATESIQREADDHAAPIRWLSLAAAATPLMGLLGTVWGMIVAFHESTTLTPDRSRSEQLSEGIYTALVTTLAGLVVAIPAAIFAQHLENRVAKLFHRIERLAFDLAPGLARFVGRARLDADGTLRTLASLSNQSLPHGAAATHASAPPGASVGNASTGNPSPASAQPATSSLPPVTPTPPAPPSQTAASAAAPNPVIVKRRVR